MGLSLVLGLIHSNFLQDWIYYQPTVSEKSQFQKLFDGTLIRSCRFLLSSPSALTSSDSGALSPRYPLNFRPIRIWSQLLFQYLSTSAQKHGGATYVLFSLLRTKTTPPVSRRLNFPKLYYKYGMMLILLYVSSPLPFITPSAHTPSLLTLP